MRSDLGYLLIRSDGIKIEKVIRLSFNTSNNEVEYKALIYTPRVIDSLGDKKIQLFTDSKLFTNKFGGKYKVRDNKMGFYLNVRSLVHKFTTIASYINLVMIHNMPIPKCIWPQ